MSGPSFERFDYQLRSNKHIERKLVFDLLLRARGHYDFAKYGYLGLGSMWFADHRLAHRLLGINKLISIEATEHANRADFNKPYGAVTVLPGMSYEVMPTWTDKDWENPFIVWMDYDGVLDEHAVEDLSIFTQKLKPNSVLLVTVNAYFGNYRIRKDAVDAAAKRGEIIDPRSVATLSRLLGNVVPEQYSKLTSLTGKPSDVKEDNFSPCIADSLLAFLSHKVTAGGRQQGDHLLRFVPLFNFCHKDGVEMVTVGGVICDSENAQIWQNVLLGEPMLARPETGLPLHHRLDLIPITLREKLVLDSILPMDKEAFAEQVNAYGLKIGIEQAEKYRKHYRHFPMFVETPI